MFKGEYKWQHDYVRLVSDTGFCFERHKTDYFDKNKISSVDIDRIIEDRDFGAIERVIPSITKFVLDPEQAQVLDQTFVKVFHLSQLSIQYLLYCKKYLDNSLVIIKEENKKAKEENKELNDFVDDLQAHISKLMKELDEKPTFKCIDCNKVFSSEDFLNSHIKRRHSTPLREAESDKLQMEIKELKGRLNNAEKMIQKEQHEDVNISKEAELKKIEELQQKFEDLRLQVQSELRVLQSQHNYQEKYEKLFKKMTLQGDVGGRQNLHRRRESTTQTEIEAEGAAKFEKKEKENDKENIPEISDTQKQMTEFGEAIESKVTSSLQKIETQMQSFWTKLNEMEKHKKTDNPLEEIEKKPKPMLRSRSKLTMKNADLEIEEAKETKKKISEDEDTDPSLKIVEFKIPKIRHSPEVRIVAAQIQKTLVVQTEKNDPVILEPEIQITKGDSSSSETLASESEISADSPEEEAVKVVKPLPVARKRPHSSSRKNDLKKVVDGELLQHFRVEVERIIMGRLQDLGVSPDWKGLPTRSVQRALEIVNHQANLVKKSHPNFDFICSQLEKTVTKKIEESDTTPKHQPERKPIKSKPKRVEVKKSTKGKVPSPIIEIKNRKMYETDSDSEIRRPQVKENLKQFSAPYSAVIEELKLKTVTSKIDSDESEEVIIKNEEQTKGVLKSYPSAGSLTKKKVLFNLNTDDDDTEEKRDGSVKDGGSTTSIASSVLDGGTPTPRKEDKMKKKVKEKDIEDLSDFDFSDM